MAGENIRLLSPKGVVSIDVVLTEDVSRGDFLVCGTSACFALADGQRGETVAMCIEADLVEVPKPTGGGWEPGEKVGMKKIEHANFGILSKGDAGKAASFVIGYVHRAAKGRDDRAEIVWRNYV